MKQPKHRRNVLLLLLALAAAVILSGCAPTSGTCGKDLKWKLKSGGRLVISGSGEMDDYENSAWTTFGLTGDYHHASESKTISPWMESKREIKSLKLPDGLMNIGSYAFNDCYALEAVSIPDGVTRIGDGAFYTCDALSNVTIPDSVTSVGQGAFRDCIALESITIPDSVSSIGTAAFSGCTSLTSITISKNVTKLGGEAFSGPRMIGSPEGSVIPNGVTQVFCNCTALSAIQVAPENPVYCSLDGVLFNKEQTILRNTPRESRTLPIPSRPA